jgi:hypothetical protein
MGKGPESATRYGMMEMPRFIFAIFDPPPTSNLFSRSLDYAGR